MDRRFFDRYLQLIQVRNRTLNGDFLEELVRAQMFRVPFENISKLYYFRKSAQLNLPTLEQYLDGIEFYHFGGTCYANNYYFHCLLKHLGFNVRLCGAAMNRPDVHVVSLVAVGESEYLVDVGYGAPFYQPLPRNLSYDYVLDWGHDRYVLKPRDELGRSRLEFYRDGQLKHGYTVSPIPRSIEDFKDVIMDSLSEKATFRNAILLMRLFPNRTLTLFNQTIIEIEGPILRKRQVATPDQLPDVIERNFGIPADITAESMQALVSLGDAWT